MNHCARTIAIALGVLFVGCAPQTMATTVVTSPAHADPGMTAFGTGVSVSGGNKVAFAASDSVVVAATSDMGGPNAKNEGDSLWRVRGGMMEFCEWSAEGRDDCRLATYEGFVAPPLLTLLPTIIESGNLARGVSLLLLGNQPALIGSVASKKTEVIHATTDHSVWVTAGIPALLGAQPVFLCAPHDTGPACTALPFVAVGIVGALVERRGKDFVSVLWLHAGQNVVAGFGGVVTPVDMGIYRCESIAGEPRCVKAKEGSQ